MVLEVTDSPPRDTQNIQNKKRSGYGGGGWEGFGDYMADKRRKLDEQITGEFEKGSVSWIFVGLSFYATGRSTLLSDIEIRKLITENGGTYDQYGYRSVHYVVADNLSLGNQNWKKYCERPDRKSFKVVTTAWLVACAQAKSLLDYRLDRAYQPPEVFELHPTMVPPYLHNLQERFDISANRPLFPVFSGQAGVIHNVEDIPTLLSRLKAKFFTSKLSFKLNIYAKKGKQSYTIPETEIADLVNRKQSAGVTKIELVVFPAAKLPESLDSQRSPEFPGGDHDLDAHKIHLSDHLQEYLAEEIRHRKFGRILCSQCLAGNLRRAFIQKDSPDTVIAELQEAWQALNTVCHQGGEDTVEDFYVLLRSVDPREKIDHRPISPMEALQNLFHNLCLRITDHGLCDLRALLIYLCQTSYAIEADQVSPVDWET